MFDVKMKGKRYLDKTDNKELYLAGTNGGGGGHLNTSQWAKSFQNYGGMWHPIAYEETHPITRKVSNTTTPEFWNRDCLASYYDIEPIN